MKRRKIDMKGHIERFHTLGGVTLSEHQKNFNLYRKSLEADVSFEPAVFFAELVPRDHQEEIFRVRLLQQFKRHDELISVVKGGNRILARIALKSDEFIRELLERYSTGVGRFTEELTPNVSYVSRLNLIYKLARMVEDEKAAERLYGEVYARYGLKQARPFLVKCGGEFVGEVLREFNVEIGERDLIALHKRSPETFLAYLKARHCGDYGMKLSTYLAKSDLDEFHRYTQIPAKFTLGKRLRERYINAHKAELVKDPHAFPLSLDSKKIARCLNADEMVELLANNFRAKRGYRYYQETGYLKCYPRRMRGYILFTAYNRAHNCNLWDNPANVEDDLLQLLSLEDRMRFDFITSYPELLPLPQAIAAIKAKINVTSDIWDRSNLCTKLLEACTYNDNHDGSLLEILKYFNTRHKNDNENARVNFLNYLNRNFALERLSKQHWDVIEELLLLVEVNKERLYCEAELLGKFLIHQFGNGIECKRTLVKFFKAVNCRSFTGLVGDYAKTCILQYPQLLSEIYATDKEVQSAKVDYLHLLVDYNGKRAREDRINLYDYHDFWPMVVERYRENRYACVELIIALLESETRDDEEQLKRETFFEQISNLGGCRSELYYWLLRKRPQVLLTRDPDEFFATVGTYGTGGRLLYEVTKCDFLGLTQRLDARGLELLDGESDMKTAAICYFSFQAKFVDLLVRLSGEYAPGDECKINVRAEDIKKRLDIQTELIRSFKNTPCPTRLIDALLAFCNGDYFKYSLEPLYFIMYHTSEDRIEAPINELLKRAVSVRKHTVHLTGALAATDLQLRVFSSMAAHEKNVSVQKYIFGKIYNHFVNEKTPQSWVLLRENIKLVTVHDEETLHKLKNIGNVPKRFLNEYLITIWDFFAAFGNKSEYDLIRYFNTNLHEADLDDFRRKVIASSLYVPANTFTHDAEVFTAKYLLTQTDNIDARLDYVWDLMKTRAESERVLQRTLNTFCSVIKDKHPTAVHKLLIAKITAKTTELNITRNLLKLELLLNSTTFYVDWDQSDAALTAYIAETHDYLTSSHTPQIVHLYRDFTEGFCGDCFDYATCNRRVLNVAKGLLERDARKYGLLAFLMLPSDFENCVEAMREIVRMLKAYDSAVLRAYLEDYLNEHPEFDDVN